MARACPERVKTGTAMSDAELAEWNDPKVQSNGKAALQKACETLYTTMALMTDVNSEGGRAMNLGVDTGDIAIGEGYKLLETFYDLFKQDATSMEDADDLAEEVTNFRSIKDESAQVLVARFNALTTKLQVKSSTMKFPDVFLRLRFLRALPTAGIRDYTNVLDRHHRGDFSTLADLQKAVLAEEAVLLKKAHFLSGNGAVAAAAHATDANLAPVSTKAAKRKAKKARRRAKALAATAESTSTTTDTAACASSCATDAKAHPPKGTGAGSSAAQPDTNKTCSSCGEVGHIAPHCPHNGAAARNTTEKVWCSHHNKHGHHLEADCSLNPASPKGKGKGKGKSKGKGKHGCGRGGYGGYPAAYNSQFHAYGRGKGEKGKYRPSALAAVHQPCGPWSNAPTHGDDSLYELDQSSTDWNY
jgi:hypothetical protein